MSHEPNSFALIKDSCVFKITGGLYAPSAKIQFLFFTTCASRRPHKLYLRRNCVKPSFFRHPDLLNYIRRWRFQPIGYYAHFLSIIIILHAGPTSDLKTLLNSILKLQYKFGLRLIRLESCLSAFFNYFNRKPISSPF